MSTNGDLIYWVESIDGEPIGDYDGSDVGGFTFYTIEEAEAFIDQTYEDELRLLAGGYYEERTELQILQIVVMRVVGMPLVKQIPWPEGVSS